MCYIFFTLSGHLTKRQNSILHAVSPASQNRPVESLNQFYFFLVRKYALFWHSAYFRNHYGRLSHLGAKYGKSPPKILSICTALQNKFSPNVLIWSKYLNIMETTGWSMPFYWYVLCIGTYLCWHAYDVIFMGCNSHFGMQKNYASATRVTVSKGSSHLRYGETWQSLQRFTKRR